jgi:hypothetical protein
MNKSFDSLTINKPARCVTTGIGTLPFVFSTLWQKKTGMPPLTAIQENKAEVPSTARRSAEQATSSFLVLHLIRPPNMSA